MMWGVGLRLAACSAAALIAAVLGAAALAICTAADGRAEAFLPARPPPVLSGGATPERFLFFAGLDLWRNSGTLYGGVLWSPDGIAGEGPVLKLLYAGGFYRYRTDTTAVLGAYDMVAALPGWRFVRGRFEGSIYGGFDLQYHRTLPGDPGNRLNGAHSGLRVGMDLWWEPLAHWMVMSSLSASSIGAGYGIRLAAGRRFHDALWIGPEIEASGSDVYRQWRIGVHVTALRFWFGEWALGAGYVRDSDGRDGVYGRLGVLVRR